MSAVREIVWGAAYTAGCAVMIPLLGFMLGGVVDYFTYAIAWVDVGFDAELAAAIWGQRHGLGIAEKWTIMLMLAALVWTISIGCRVINGEWPHERGNGTSP